MIRARVFLCLAVAGLATAAWHIPRAAARALPATAMVAPPPLPPGGSYVPLGDGMRIQGLPVFVWLLDAPGSLRDIALWLTARQPALRDIWVAPGAVVVAGAAEGMHWAARLSDAGGGRTQGSISVLPVDAGPAAGIAGSRDLAVAGFGWPVPGGQLHFEFRSRDEGASVIEQVWTHGLAPAPLRQKLFDALAAGGWRAGGADAGGRAARPTSAEAPQEAYSWSRGRITLSTVIVPLDQGSGITAVVRIGG